MVKTFMHSGKMGDIIWALPFIKYQGGGKLYLHLNQKDPNNGENKLGEQSANRLISLINTQDYVEAEVSWTGQEKVDFNLDKFRDVIYSCGKSIAESYFVAFDVKDDYTKFLSQPWLNVPDCEYHGKVVVSRTRRYLPTPRNPFYNHLVKSGLDHNGFFVGHKEEHEVFCSMYDSRVTWVNTYSILDLAKIIAGASLFAGNENLANAINEGLKKTAFLESQKNNEKNNCFFLRPNLFII